MQVKAGNFVGQPVRQFRKQAASGGIVAVFAPARDNVETRFQLLDERQNIARVILQITVERNDVFARGRFKSSVERGGLAYWVAAIRECFEEAGVLLAHANGAPTGSAISQADDEVAERFRAYRAEVDAGHLRLTELCQREDLRLAAEQIHYFSHWITPEGAPRRYDTRFFVAAAPPEQVPLHDDKETIANTWIRPADALARFEAGDFDLIFPTIKNLEAIGQFARARDVLDSAEAIGTVPTILPRLTSDDDGVRILLPGDQGYDEALGTPQVPADFLRTARTGPVYPKPSSRG